MRLIQAAISALRARTGRSYAAAAKAGRLQLQVVTYDARGKSTIQPVTDWLTPDALLRAVAVTDTKE